jgi:hypothetical protein
LASISDGASCSAPRITRRASRSRASHCRSACSTRQVARRKASLSTASLLLPSVPRDRQCLHLILRRLQHGGRQAGQHLANVIVPALEVVVGDQADQECGFLERIGHVVRLLDQPGHGPPAGLALGLVARLHHQVVGLALPGLRTRGEFRRGLA